MRYLPLFAAALLAACSPVYVFKSWRGHHRLLSRQRSITEVLADPSALPEVKEKLKLVEEIRAFAFETMGLKKSRNYTTFVSIPGPNVTINVTAAKKTVLVPYQWWFPVIGKVPYKGFFDLDDALKEKAGLDKRGYDTYLSGVRAYSTLGWSRDPVLSTMLAEPPAELAELLIHELTHGTVFFKGRVDFNEALATFVGQEGSEEFLRRRFGQDSPELRQARELREQESGFTRRMDVLYSELQALYSSPLLDEEKLERRRAVFDKAAPGLGFAVGGSTRTVHLNNAVVLAHHRYHYELGDFRRAFDQSKSQWPEFFALIRSLDRRRPREALRERLAPMK